jgi:hypothetical protein
MLALPEGNLRSRSTDLARRFILLLPLGGLEALERKRDAGLVDDAEPKSSVGGLAPG